MENSASLRIFFPTRFHIFDQLATSVFETEIISGQIEIYTIYPKRYLRMGRFAKLVPSVRTLWLGLALYGLLRLASRLGLQGQPLQRLREIYIRGCALEFTLRMRMKVEGVVLATAGYLGSRVGVLQRAGHRVVINHGSLYEPYARQRMQFLPIAIEDASANWTNLKLITRMDTEFDLADAVIVCSPTARNSFPESIQPKISIVVLGARPKSIKKKKYTRQEKFTFIHVSNLTAQKNIAGILDAFKMIRGETDQLIVVGPLPTDPTTRARLQNPEPGVAWLGQLDRSSVDDELEAAHIFVHPSFSDGWAMAVTEALAAGLPVVSSADTGSASFYAAYSARGSASVLLADPYEVSEIAHAMTKLRDSRVGDPNFAIVEPISWLHSAELLRDALVQHHQKVRHIGKSNMKDFYETKT